VADAGNACSASISILSVSSTSDADFNSPPTVISREDCPVELVHAAVTAVLPENVDVVDSNKMEAGGSLATSKESLTASGSGGCLMTNVDSGSVSSPVKSCSVTLTPLQQLMTVPTSSPLRELTITPSKRQGSSSRTLTPSSSQSPKSTVVKSKSPRKSSTPSKSLTPTKSPTSSQRQRSLMEMFAHGDVALTSKVDTELSSSASEPASSQPTAEVLEDGQKVDASPACEQQEVNVEVLVEDSQMGAQTLPVDVIDTQESMFVDETPPHSKSSYDDAVDDDTDDGTQSKPPCDFDVVIADTCDTDSFRNSEVSQQTVVHVDANETVTSDTPLDTTSQPTVSNIGNLSAVAVNIVSTSSVQASNATDGSTETSLADVHSTAMCSDDMPHGETKHNQSDEIDHTQEGCLNRGRVSRNFIVTRPTRLNLRTRSVRRLTDKLVSVGAKKVDRIPSHPTGVRKRGRPKGSKSHSSRGPEVTNDQAELEMQSRLPCRAVKRRRCKSVWMQAAAAEDDVAVTSTASESPIVSDVHAVTGMKSSVEVSEDLAERQSDVDVRKVCDRVTAFKDTVMTVSDEQVTVCTEKLQDTQNVDEDLDVNIDVEPAAGEVPVTESSGTPDSGLSLCQEMTVGENDVSCDKPESDINLSQIMVTEDSKVDLSAELTGEGQTSSGSSELSPTLNGIAIGSQVDTMSTNTAISNDIPVSQLSTNYVAVTESTSAHSDDVNAAVEVHDIEPTNAAGNDVEELSKNETVVEKSTPPLPPDVDGECQWKVPTSSVKRAPPVPPETPTSIPRRRFASRGSLMLERSKQLRQSAASSPPVH